MKTENALIIAEQAALFAVSVDMDRLDTKKVCGAAELYTLLASHALHFCQVFPDEDGETWEKYDWYVESDHWFDERIAPDIYKDKCYEEIDPEEYETRLNNDNKNA